MSVTEALAEYVTHSTYEAIPRDVRDEAKRAIVNYLGCALGGSVESALDVAIRTLAPYSGNATACVLGRAERFDALHAALLNGIGSHVHDTTTRCRRTIFTPACLWFGVVRLRERESRLRPRFRACVHPRFEVESRIGNAVYPAHYAAGWHITSTTGVFGAAAAIGKLLGLTTKQMVWALGLAATQAAGLREMFGSMAKSFQPGPRGAERLHGRAAGTGGLHGRRARLEGPRGFAAVKAAQYDLCKVTAGFARLPAPLQRLQALRLRPCRAPDDRRMQPTASRISSRRTALPACACASRRSCSTCATRAISRARSKASTRSITLPPSVSCAARAASGVHRRSRRRPGLAARSRRHPAVCDDTITEDQAHIEVVMRNGESCRSLSSSRSATSIAR